ncbi:hypothetical protein TNCV_4451921 [Trichonephila clavipes]|nr:hypothetical protein TNCV_4451921 [Trichonephila clavipes]
MVYEDDSFLQKIVTGDETWCFLNNLQTKRLSSEWKAKILPKEKLRLDKSRGKCDEATEEPLKKWIPGAF